MSLVAAALLAGCGNDRTPPPDVSLIRAPGAFRTVIYPASGISLRMPTRWRAEMGEGTRVATVSTGLAQITVWRFAREEPLPVTRTHLDNARKALIDQVKARDPTFVVSSSRVILHRGLRAVEIVGVGTNQGKRRRARSLHAYGRGAEIVVDAFAPPKDFQRVDEQTFRPVLRSLKLRAPRS
jgi:hypothetical protein